MKVCGAEGEKRDFRFILACHLQVLWLMEN